MCRGHEGSDVRHSWKVLLAMVAVAGCERTRVTPPMYLEDLHALPTPVGIDVSFVLLDRNREPTVMMFGAGVIRIEDIPDTSDAVTREEFRARALSPGDSAAARAAGTLDSTWLLYNARMFISRDHFTRERRATASGERIIEVCWMGVYPYRHFLRKPRRPDGVVRVALVTMDGRHVMTAHQRVVWPPEAFAEEVGRKVSDRFGDK